MSAMPTRMAYRPGPLGRVVRLVLGVVSVQAAIGAVLALTDGVSGPPDLSDTGLVVAVIVAAWLTPLVYDVGLGKHLGNGWRLIAAAGIAVSTVVGLVLGAPGTGLTVGLQVWVAVTMGWLGVAFVIAAALRTPGCEMRSLPHLASVLLPGNRQFVACPGPLQPLDEWEARTTGRADPHLPDPENQRPQEKA